MRCFFTTHPARHNSPIKALMSADSCQPSGKGLSMAQQCRIDAKGATDDWPSLFDCGREKDDTFPGHPVLKRREGHNSDAVGMKGDPVDIL